MSNYLRSTKFETEFDGDTVTCRLKPIKQGDAMRLFNCRGDTPFATQAALLPVFAEIVPIYAEDLQGLRAADGSPVAWPEVTRDMYFSTLLVKIGMALIATGNLPDPKAPASQPADTSQA